jgi:hypothetical protein
LLARAVELAPENPQFALVNGVALVELGRRDEGLAALEAAAARFPSDARIRDALRAFRAQ